MTKLDNAMLLIIITTVLASVIGFIIVTFFKEKNEDSYL